MFTTSTGDDELGRIFQVEGTKYNKKQQISFLSKGREAGKQSPRLANVWDSCWGLGRDDQMLLKHLLAARPCAQCEKMNDSPTLSPLHSGCREYVCSQHHTHFRAYTYMHSYTHRRHT